MTDAIPGALTRDIRTWAGLVRTGAWAAIASVVLIVLQIAAFVVWPPPQGVAGFYELLQRQPLQGLVALDVLYPVSNTLTYLLYLALAVVLWRVSRSAVVVAIAFGTLGMAAYFASPRPVDMLRLAELHAVADPGERAVLEAVGEGMLSTWNGTAFDVYYLLNFLALVIFAVLVHRSPVFSRTTGAAAMIAAILMAVPSNFGTVGLVFALTSLLPWAIFALLVARTLFSLVALAGQGQDNPTNVRGSGPEGGYPGR
ncbi:hypothetical protein [Corynebacterium guangdongense]|uniref:DUF4386 family protein n=1 Tax=Corynebacterium guangdongense TaxID=1783348 RepID=A0ABU1ZVJ8_9CORY|nr:hypothetical protein [Corynebacterium guangdongense]MDR7328954.1 hypothetical protein [Corynebacterium guangdongense]WJZ17527.1 hypothetical protein CGUA_04705 [Corynebacterium guangdongense]